MTLPRAEEARTEKMMAEESILTRKEDDAGERQRDRVESGYKI
jgi:hypothetical protein